MSDTSDEAEPAGRVLLRGLGQFLWCLIPLASLGSLAFLPAAQAWWKARTAGWAITASMLTIISVTIVTGYAVDSDNSTFLGMMLFVAWIGGITAAVAGRGVVFSRDSRPKVDPAVQGVIDQRERRHTARQIAETDLAMALELGIGHPERGRTYDDGGLVDLNNASPEAVSWVLNWTPDRARTFVAERDKRYGYESLEELAALSVIRPSELDRVAEYILLLPYRATPPRPPAPNPDQRQGESGPRA